MVRCRHLSTDRYIFQMIIFSMPRVLFVSFFSFTLPLFLSLRCNIFLCARFNISSGAKISRDARQGICRAMPSRHFFLRVSIFSPSWRSLLLLHFFRHLRYHEMWRDAATCAPDAFVFSAKTRWWDARCACLFLRVITPASCLPFLMLTPSVTQMLHERCRAPISRMVLAFSSVSPFFIYWLFFLPSFHACIFITPNTNIAFFFTFFSGFNICSET